MDRSRSVRRRMAGNASQPGKLREQLLDAVGVLRDFGVEFRVRAFHIGVGNNPRPAVPWTGNEDRTQVVLLDDPVHVRVDKIESRRRSKVSEQTRLSVLKLQRFAQKRVVTEINLSDGEIVGGTPVTIELVKLFGRKRSFRVAAFLRVFLRSLLVPCV